MTTNQNNSGSKRDLSELIDLLVEGELNSKERTELLLRLDDSTDGWKMCAISFMESLSIKKVVRQTTNGTLTPASNDRTNQLATSPLEKTIAPAPSFKVAKTLAQLAALAAMVALAFFLGTQITGSNSPMVVKDKIDDSTNELSSETKLPEANDSQVAAKDEIHLVGHVTMDDSIGNRIRLPILSGPGDRGNWVKEASLNIPNSHRKQLSRAGWKIEKSQRLVSLNFRGEELTIPIEQLNYEYVGNPTF